MNKRNEMTPEEYRAHQNERAHDYIARAEALFAAGFTTKSAKKDAIELVTRAYEILFDEAVSDLLLASRPEGEIKIPNGGDELYWGRPQLHVWKAKHADMFRRFPEQVKIANELKALRDKFNAAELQAKPKSKTELKAEARGAIAKTCQICGRPILAETGVIAHHGYQRPGHGWQTASCYGARELPFEVSRDCLGRYIDLIVKQLESQIRHRDATSNELIHLTVSYWTGKYDGRGERVVTSYTVQRGDFDALREEHAKSARYPSDLPRSYDDVKTSELARQDREIASTRRYLSHQRSRYVAWKAVA